MDKRKISLVFLLSFFCWSIYAQQTSVFTEANLAYKRGMDFYNKGIFGLAQNEFKTAVDLLVPVNEPQYSLLTTKSKLHFAKCAVRQNLPEGEKLILDFIRDYSPDPMVNLAIIEMANYYYNAKKYKKAVSFFSMLNTNSLTRDERSEVLFKMGYAFFVKKKFSKAKANFQKIKEVQNQYFYPSNYYYGMVAFFEGNYQQAIKSFERVKKSKKYANHIPYYITQIYFAEGQYDKVINYGAPLTKKKSIRNLKEIHQLVGQAFFEKKEYKNALPYLEYYGERSNKMRVEDFYQLGFVQYKTGNFAKAVKNFEELSKVDSPLGQNALYNLGDCYIRVGKKNSARNAFAAASRMNYDSQVQEESLYNYAKLSYELKYDGEAVTALQKIKPTSPYHTEAQTIMSAIFLNTRDYERAMRIIEQLPNKTPELRKTYQKVAYNRGLQLYRDDRSVQAVKFFKKSLEVPVDQRTKALAIYWLGEIAHNQNNYDASIAQLSQFLNLSRGMKLPDEASIHMANYTQGYNYLKKKKYKQALGYFQGAVGGIKQNEMFISNNYVKQKVLGDATLRAGDCLFKGNEYNQAIRFYNEAINNKYSGYVYAYYQKAIIEGLRGNTVEKILALERIATSYSNSEYADDALFELGSTYQEMGQLNKAKNPLKQLINNYKNKSELVNATLIKLGLITYNQGSYQTAIDYYKQVFSNNPTPKEAQGALAALEEIYIEDLGKPNDYFAFLESINYDVNSEEKESISFKSAETQFENGNYDRAISGYKRYLRSYPNGRNSLTAHYHLGESYAVQKNYRDALTAYEGVVTRGQSKYYAKALNKAALIAYNDAKDFNKSYEYYSKLEKVATTEEMKFDAQLGALRSAYRSNRPNEINAMARKVVNNPRASDYQKATANFYIGKFAMDKKNYDEALSAFNQVTRLSDDEQTAEARYNIAYIYYLRRDLEIAKQLCINANKESSNYQYWVAKSVILLSDILAEQGDLFNARAALEGLVENYKEDQELINIAKQKLAKLNTQTEASSRLRAPDDNTTLELIDDNSNN